MYAGPQLTSDINATYYSKPICPKAYSTSGITFTCTISGRELHWMITVNNGTPMWTSTVFNDSCDIRHERNIQGLNITGHQPSCNTSKGIIKSKVTVTPDPNVFKPEALNVSCYTYSNKTRRRVYSPEKFIKFSSKLIPNIVLLL